MKSSTVLEGWWIQNPHSSALQTLSFRRGWALVDPELDGSRVRFGVFWTSISEGLTAVITPPHREEESEVHRIYGER